MKTTRRSRELTEARRCIERWRRERTSRKEAIPAQVWDAAVAAARVDGIWGTSQALRLEFNRLKARVVGARGKALVTTHSDAARSGCESGGVGGRAMEAGKARARRVPAFVEVVLDPAREAAAAGSAGKAVIELTGRAGERMRIEVASLTAAEDRRGAGAVADVLEPAAMMQLTPQMRILVAVEPVDFRRGIDGLCRLCRTMLAADPFTGTVFVFRSRRGTAIKVLAYDGQGFWLCQKRLSAGKFRYWPGHSGEVQRELLAHELQVLLAGGNPDAAPGAPQWRSITPALAVAA